MSKHTQPLVLTRKVSSRELRRSLKANDELLSDGLVPSVQSLIANQGVLMARIEALQVSDDQAWKDLRAYNEALKAVAREAVAAYAVTRRGFWGRLAWLVSGR